MPTIFVDGSEGTTGLRIHDYLVARPDLDVIAIDPVRRKDAEARSECLNRADLAILCLPDAASREAVHLIENPATRVIDASTAFRTHPDWVYGLPELQPGQREAVQQAQRVAIGGCHATGFIIAARPLVQAGLLPADYPVTLQSLTGYSGGGKKMIGRFEAAPPQALPICPYALGLQHKHLPEMQAHTGLLYPPLFTPAVGHFLQGMLVTIPIVKRLAPQATVGGLHRLYTEYYAAEPAVRVMPLEINDWLDEGLLDPTGCNGTNRIDLYVTGHDDQMAIIARLDNLGKGAAGAAVQALNLMLGVDEFTGLTLH